MSSAPIAQRPLHGRTRRRRIEYDRLVRAARTARRHAYAPYSHFSVGAAVLAGDGSVYAGANVENASFGLTQCAERVAIQSAVAAGHRQLRVLAVAGPDGISPCGACRQVMSEFGIRTVLVAAPAGPPAVLALADLLPRPFGPARLPRRRMRTGSRSARRAPPPSIAGRRQVPPGSANRRVLRAGL
jgi:homotetrameric cytidine deaminase